MVALASVEEYLAGKSPEAVALFRRFEAQVEACGPIVPAPSRTVVYWKRERVFAGAHANGRRLELVIDLLREAEHPRLLSAFKTTKRVVTHRLRVTEPEQLDESIQALLQEAYDDVGRGSRHAPFRLIEPAQHEPARRPRGIAAVAVVLILVGVMSALAGIVLTAASSCCGSSDPADPTPTLVGVVVAAAMSVAGAGLWSGRVSSRVLLLCGAAVPAVVLAAAASSSDFEGLVPVVLLGWLWLWWFLRRPVAIGWVGRNVKPRSDTLP